MVRSGLEEDAGVVGDPNEPLYRNKSMKICPAMQEEYDIPNFFPFVRLMTKESLLPMISNLYNVPFLICHNACE